MMIVIQLITSEFIEHIFYAGLCNKSIIFIMSLKPHNKTKENKTKTCEASTITSPILQREKVNFIG